jgi:hypothetical protein
MLAAGARRRSKQFVSRAEARQRFARKPGFSSFTSTSLDAYVQHDLLEKNGAPSELSAFSLIGVGISHLCMHNILASIIGCYTVV